MKLTRRSIALGFLQFLCALALAAGLYLAFRLALVGFVGFAVGLSSHDWQLTIMAFFGIATVLLASAACFLALSRIYAILHRAQAVPFRPDDGRCIAGWLGVILLALLPIGLAAIRIPALYMASLVTDTALIVVLMRAFRRRHARREIVPC